jgi:hypothetical protein
MQARTIPNFEATIFIYNYGGYMIGGLSFPNKMPLYVSNDDKICLTIFLY